MYLLVFGSRTFDDHDLLCRVLDDLYPVRVGIIVIEGEAPGADRMSKRWANARGIDVLPMPADWSRQGGVAGFLRNSLMVDHCNEAVGFWDGKSRGTKDTIDKLKAAGKKCTLVYFTPKNNKKQIKPTKEEIKGVIAQVNEGLRLKDALFPSSTEKDANEIINKLELVPLFASSIGEECVHDQSCKYGLRVNGHAVYCENKDWKDKPRKCRRSWYSGEKTRDEDCPGFKLNESK